MSTGRPAESDRSRLEEIRSRLGEIAARLGDPEVPDAEATKLAEEAAGLVGEALEQAEQAVAGLEPGD